MESLGGLLPEPKTGCCEIVRALQGNIDGQRQVFGLDLDHSRFEFCVVRFEGYASERELE